MSDDGKMTREEIKEFIFDVYVEVIEATGRTPAFPPEELAPLADETTARMKGCMMELVSEGVLEKFKEDGDLYFRLAEDVLDELIEEMEAEGWEVPTDPFGAEALEDEESE